jgi:hypothetical protein
VLSDELVRIEVVRQAQDIDLEAIGEQDFETALGGGDAGRIRVEIDDNLPDISTEEAHLVVGQSRSEAGHQVLNPRLIRDQEIEVALDEDDKTASPNGLPGVRESKEVVPLGRPLFRGS